MGRDSALFKHLTQVDFEEIRQKGTSEAKEVIDRVANTGLEYFLDGPHVLYKEAVEEFFNTATISDDKITATVCACQILSATKEPIKVSGSKSTLKPEYIPICDIFARAILARGGNYSSLTRDKIRMLVGLIEGTKVNWAKAVFHNLMEMVKPDSNRSWGYTVPLGGRKKKAGKKAASTKEKAESQGKEKVTFSEPPQPTEDEESATPSERTDTEKTDDERSANEEEHSGQSPDNAGPDTNPETTEGGEEDGEEGGNERGNEEEKEDEEAEADRVALKLLKVTEKRAGNIEEIYQEWHEHRFGKRYRHILPGYTDEECFQRMKEVEDVIMDLTTSDTVEEVLNRTYLLKPRALLRKLIRRIRKITAKFEEVGSGDTLTPLVLERLEKAKGDLIQEIDRLEAMYGQREIPVYTAPRIDTSPDHCPTPPRANSATEESDERANPPLTGQSTLKQPDISEPEVSEPGATKEWVESRLQRFEDSTKERVDSRIQEFEDSEVFPLKEKFQRTVCSALKFANTTWQLLERTKERFSEIDEDQREEAVLRSKHLRRTMILEDTTSEIKQDFGRLERETDQRLTEVANDLVGTTLGRVSELEKKNEGLEAELKALSEQVAELLNAKMNADAAAVEADAQAAKKVQDELDAEARKEKEAPRSSQLTEEEEEAERIRRAEAKFPGLAKKAAAQAAKDAARLERESQRLEGYATANKKKKETAASSIPAKRKREPSKKTQVADLLNEVTETVIKSRPQQTTQDEDEVEEHLRSRSTRQRVSEPASQPQPAKKKRNKNLIACYDFSDSE
ncbi:calponin homology domain-containing protein DDB_G0272472-like [Impatiens glandulifera]|uniref:calponin homology domain-containing protein DDB_G0272472-like n=1 Tax=Impatiens glandulifera TaxID=253017 RepID=UPI001FB05CBB|nr:calponin homology domain-containing protein DDB_G0272472-like [Impatiens glandulifera]